MTNTSIQLNSKIENLAQHELKKAIANYAASLNEDEQTIKQALRFEVEAYLKWRSNANDYHPVD